MEEKNYLYTGPDFPENCPVDKKVVLTAQKEHIVWPPVWGRAVGEDTEKYGRVSYIVKDQKAGNTDYLDKLLEAGCTTSYTRHVLRENKDTGTHEELFVTVHYLMYKAEDAMFDAPTVEEGVSDACNVETDALIEVALSMDEGDWKRYFYFPLKTAGPFSVNLVDFIQNDLEEAFEELVNVPDSGVVYVNEEKSFYIQFFNPVGDAEELSFGTLSELFHNIVGIRFVQMDNRIVKRKP